MKRKTRDIVVRDMKFGYVVSEKGTIFPGHLRLKIWPVECGRGQKLELRVRFDDPWLNTPEIARPNLNDPEGVRHEIRPVTPSVIRQMIEWAIEFGWTPSYEGDTLRLDWCRQRPCGFDPSQTNNGEQDAAQIKRLPL